MPNVAFAQSKPSVPQRRAQEEWRSYNNVRYKYAVDYPSALLFPQGESDNGDGQRFLTKNAKTRLIVYGANNVSNETIASRFARDRRGGTDYDPERVVAYVRQKDNWYVVSGYRKGKIFYRKCYRMNGYFVALEVTYPETERAFWDKMTTQISRSFQPQPTR